MVQQRVGSEGAVPGHGFSKALKLLLNILHHEGLTAFLSLELGLREDDSVGSFMV